MSIQSVINSAQTIEISRPALVASSLSRSGRLFTGTRNWAKPWRITVSPKPIWRIADARPVIESIMTNDKHTEQTVYLGQGGASWITAYQGGLTNSQLTTGLTVQTASTSGTNMRLVLNAELIALDPGTVFFRAGDIIQPVGHRYPYVITTQRSRSDCVTDGGITYLDVQLNRGVLPQTGYSISGATIVAGTACSWRIKVGSLPTYRFVSGQFVEFTGDFELIESITT
jgi:hypothetical protein